MGKEAVLDMKLVTVNLWAAQRKFNLDFDGYVKDNEMNGQKTGSINAKF